MGLLYDGDLHGRISLDPLSKTSVDSSSSTYHSSLNSRLRLALPRRSRNHTKPTTATIASPPRMNGKFIAAMKMNISAERSKIITSTMV